MTDLQALRTQRDDLRLRAARAHRENRTQRQHDLERDLRRVTTAILEAENQR